MLSNVLVRLAVWLSVGAMTTSDMILAVVFPVSLVIGARLFFVDQAAQRLGGDLYRFAAQEALITTQVADHLHVRREVGVALDEATDGG